MLNQCLISAVCVLSVVSLFKRVDKCAKEMKLDEFEDFAHTRTRTGRYIDWKHNAEKAVSPKFTLLSNVIWRKPL